jgi:DNA mismatch endonuclease (patch repair protein)
LIDVVDSATRSRMMSGIKSKNTLPEIRIRKALHARGFRYRIHVPNIPGKPDIVLPKYNSLIMVHGCFWHGHSCRYFKVPKSRTQFWLDKIGKNQARDQVQLSALTDTKWKVLIVWECAIREMRKEKGHDIIDQIERWILQGADVPSGDHRSPVTEISAAESPGLGVGSIRNCTVN